MPQATKSRKPVNTAFKQQRLKAWQPLLTPRSVLPTLFVVGIIFAPLGGFLLWSSQQVSEIVIDYTQCTSVAHPEFAPAPANIYSYSGPNPASNPTIQWKRSVGQDNLTEFATPGTTIQADLCTIQFSVPTAFQNSVFLYYRLTNFFQNHRRYVKSFDSNQLKGTLGTPDKNCSPLDTVNGTWYYPCGLIANSMFNDTISNLTAVNGGTDFNFYPNGIAWPSDRDRYGPPPANADVSQLVPPPNWINRYKNGVYAQDTLPDFRSNERFQVWMRTAGLPNFRKLYGRNDDAALAAGTYEIRIFDHFKVDSFGGTKSIVISTVSFLGGKNPFLGIAYMVVGCICILLGVVFTARHLYKPRKLGDHSYLSWNQDQNNNAHHTQ